MIFEESTMLRHSDTGKDLLDRVANEMPDAQRVQLLRSAIGQAWSMAETRINASLALPKYACSPVRVIVVYPACSVLRPFEDISHGRLVIASRRACRLAKRMKILHQL